VRCRGIAIGPDTTSMMASKVLLIPSFTLKINKMIQEDTLED
jgi:hypothetical protein